MYFKNTKRSGGGNILKCTTRNDLVCITFESGEVAQRVVNKKDHSLAGQELCVAFCEPEEKSGAGEENRRKILLSNIPKNIDKEFIALYLEDMAESTDIHVEKVNIDSEDESAVVEFTEQIAADTILKHKELKMKEKTILVEAYSEKKETFCTIEVTGSSDIEKEMDKLRLYFRNMRRSGGGTIVDSCCKRDIAYFTFESEEVARRVVNTDHSRQELTVKLMKEKAQPLVDNSADIPSSTVRVRGVTKDIKRETLSFYFESERHSGGGQIESLSSDEDDNSMVYVHFASNRVAKRVVEKDQTLQGKSLRVSLHNPLPYYDNKILIKGLKSTTTKDALILFLEARAGVEPISIDYHEEEEDTVLVTVKNKLDFKTIEKACHERKLEGACLTVSRVHVSNCILVSNLPSQTSKDMILFYFENTKKKRRWMYR
ncbi:protein mono-ADP-ribosyltransferase PARP10-like [Mercenaria mercenaria]|uniref:protein mono-ADP-ribosyltransferase PARP10-like n=1 Tax=Mercenaria mercenaria TaxID=6596 RepID=UPI00234ED377|nr:protein mono-ADP-ribosyltransferase PARP10-like [Mercenaria mercenaria]